MKNYDPKRFQISFLNPFVSNAPLRKGALGTNGLTDLQSLQRSSTDFREKTLEILVRLPHV